MFYVLYGADGSDQSDRFLITWCENYNWVVEYADSIGDDADFDIYMKEYPCHRVDELEDVINLEIRSICGKKANESIRNFQLQYIPFRNRDDYILIVASDYWILSEWDAEMVDSFLWSIENDLLIPLVVLAKFMDSEVREEMMMHTSHIHHLIHEITEFVFKGKYSSALERLDYPALCKYFLPSAFTKYERHTINAFHLHHQKITSRRKVIHGKCKGNDRPVHDAKTV